MDRLELEQKGFGCGINRLFWFLLACYAMVLGGLVWQLDSLRVGGEEGTISIGYFLVGMVLVLPAFIFDHRHYLMMKEAILSGAAVEKCYPKAEPREMLTGLALSTLPGIAAPIYYLLSYDLVGTLVLAGVSLFLFFLFKPL